MYYAPEFDKVFSGHSDIRAFYKSVFFPGVIEVDHLTYLNIWPLVYSPPEVEPHQIAEPTGVIEIEGQWVQQWAVRSRAPEELPSPEEPAMAQVPQQISVGQGREALYNAGLFANVQPAIDAIKDPDTKWRVQNAWDYRPTWERQSPFVAMMASILGLDDDQTNELFISAASL
jgi:hypothetical protein